MLRDMLPQSTSESVETGLIDIMIGTSVSTRPEITSLCIDKITSLLSAPASSRAHCAPWCRPASTILDIVSAMCESKRKSHAARETPLLHYRNEELSQMLLDSFHPKRSIRYHTRRYKFIRKIKTSGTAARYANELAGGEDEEEKKEFDDAEGWVRGEEWAWAGLPIPESMATSAWTRIDLYPGLKTSTSTSSSSSSDSEVTTPPPQHSPNMTQFQIPGSKTDPPRSAFSPDLQSGEVGSPGSTAAEDCVGERTIDPMDPADPLAPGQRSEPSRSYSRKSTSGVPRSVVFEAENPVSPSSRKERSGKLKMFKRISDVLRSPGSKTISSPNPPLSSTDAQTRPGTQKGEGYDLGYGHEMVNRPIPAGIAGNKGTPAAPNTPPSLDQRKKTCLPLPVDITINGGPARSGESIPEYVRPKVEGEDQVEFPCFFDPDSTQSVQGVKRGKE